MGLLGDGWDSEQSQMIMGLAQGLLSARGGQGLAAGLGNMQAVQQNRGKSKLLNAQLANYESEIEARKLAGVKDARQQALIASMFGGGGESPSGAPSGLLGGAPGASTGSGGGNLVQLAEQYGIPRQAIQSDMVFNGGKGISDMLFKRGAPDMQVTNGYAYDKNRQGAGYLPQLNISNDGKATQVQIGADGQPVISAPRGAPETFGTYQGIEAGVKSANTPMQVSVPGPDGTPQMRYLPQSTVLGNATQPVLRPQKLSPMAPRPGESDREAIFNQEMKAAQGRLKMAVTPEQTTRAQSDIDGLGREMQRIGMNPQQSQPAGFAAGPSSGESAAAKAAEATAVETAKADVQSTQGRQAGKDNAMNAYKLVDQALAHPGLPKATGLQGAIDPRNYIPGTDGKNFDSIAKQLQGNAFLSAFASLKGAGQITEVEGVKATAAIARLQQAQSTDEYKTALKDYQEVIGQGLKRMGVDTSTMGGGAAPAAPANPQPAAPKPMKGMVRGGYKFKGGNPADQSNWEKQ